MTKRGLIAVVLLLGAAACGGEADREAEALHEPIPAAAIAPGIGAETLLDATATLAFGRVPGSGARVGRGDEDGRVPHRAVRGARADARQPRRDVGAVRAAGRNHAAAGRRPLRDAGQRRAHLRARRRLRGLDQARGRRGRGGVRRVRVRRLRRARAGVRLGRLRRRGPARQDPALAGQRPAARRHLRRAGDDLLRALDLQARDGGRAGRGRVAGHPRAGAGGLSVGGGREHALRGIVRPRRRRRQPEPRHVRGLGAAGHGREAVPHGRPRLRGGEAAGCRPLVRAPPARRDRNRSAFATSCAASSRRTW